MVWVLIQFSLCQSFARACAAQWAELKVREVQIYTLEISQCEFHNRCLVTIGDLLMLAQRATKGRVRRMRRTGDQGRDACVPRVTMDGHPGLARSRDCAAQWSPRACAKQGLRSAMRFDPVNSARTA